MTDFFEDVFSIGVPGTEGDPLQDVFPGRSEDPLFGGQAAEVARSAAETQALAGQEALGLEREGRAQAQQFFEPFAGAAERGLEASGFLADPQAQFDFLQNNPLFQLALENANQRTRQSASASRRLSFGDTLQQLSNNVLLSASPLIDRQRQDVTNLLQFGGDIAGSQANIAIGEAANLGRLTTDIGATRAGGEVGAANALAQGGQNLLSTGLGIAGLAFSDERLKTNRKFIGKKGVHSWWSWDWNELAGKLFGLFGHSEGVMSREVIKINPSAVILDDSGFYKVNYGDLNGS